MKTHFDTDSDLNKVAQIWIAFGQGTGGMPVAASAVDAATEEYHHLESRMMSSWDLYAEEILTYSRELGLRSKQAAQAAQSSIILGVHVLAGIPGVAVICPC